jgi:phage terminase large subunit GpA-like protein
MGETAKMANRRRKRASKRLVQRVCEDVRGYDIGVNGSVSGDGVTEILGRMAGLVRPSEKVDPIAWLEAHRRLSPEASAEPGVFHFDRIPYAVEPQRAILNPATQEVVLMWASQCAKTEIATLNPLLYWSVTAPAPCLIVTPDWKSAHSLSRDRIDMMLRDSRVVGIDLADESSGGPGSDNSMFRKTVGNGMGVTIVNAASASALAQRPVRYLIFEEVSRLPSEARGPRAGGLEGDVVSLARVRTSTFSRDAKIIYSSSPIEKELCRVSALFEASTGERYHCRCPRGHLQILLLADMDFKSATCKCHKCRRSYRQEDWQERPGRWIALDPTHPRRGFWMNIWPSPFVEWPTVYEEWRAAIDLKRQGDWSLYRSVCGTRLAEAMKRPGETLAGAAAKLIGRREVFGAKLPDAVKVLVAGVDTQDTWLEYLVLGFGARRECWALETGVVLGRLDMSGEQMYAELFEHVVSKQWERADGRRMVVKRMLQDCGGHLSNVVCQTLKPHWPRLAPYRGMAIKDIWQLGEEKTTQRAKIICGNSSLVKESVGGMLAIEAPGPGYVHFPVKEDGSDAAGFSKEFFEQLVESEKKDLVLERGLRHWRWKQIRDRNEALDTFVMALIALETLKLNLDVMTPIVVDGGGAAQQMPEELAEALARSPQRPRMNWGL